MDELQLRKNLLKMAQNDVERLQSLVHKPADECRQTVSVVAARLGATLKSLQNIVDRELAETN
jgi:hypothetical protein